ncbi:DUF1707 SHOCT-like domain-containing protein [Catenulispora rubra]|uniref:DUF1707 SHOCT-like domain-containing protein n=1 Tax=Catenulispora rubra TaxID=280293 RepID=UPI0018925442|nr:DUF1707 domain-containing protein [Catenulispora rubra]
MTTQGGASFDPDMRAGDADRERLVEQLREHHAAGRLTLDEFDERMTKAYSAKTYGELRTLTRDLPVDLSQLNIDQAQQRTFQQRTQQRPVEVRRDESGRMQINIDNQAIQDRINEHLERHTQRWQRHQERHEQHRTHQQERWKQQAARRGGHGWGSFSSWLSLTVLLTGIWLVSNLAGGDDWGNFWPAWPVGIMGVLMLARGINKRS